MVRLTIRGKTKTIKEWADHFGVNYSTAYSRYRRGYPIKEVFKQEHSEIKGGRPKGKKVSVTECCFPDCFDCPYPDCMNNSAAKPIETEIVKEARRRLPDSEGTFEHVHMIAGGNIGKAR